MKPWVILMWAFMIAATSMCSTVAYAQEQQEESPVFIDENGDGIDDRVTLRHRQSKRMGGSALLSVLSAQLTKAQRTTLQAKINELLAIGATPDEIQKAVFAELEGFGVDLTGTFLERFDTMLTKDQMSALRKKTEALRANGASYSDIQKAIHEELSGMGIAWDKRGSDQFGALITKDQMSALQRKIDGLVAGGASRVDIQKAIDAELQSMGIDLPSMNKRRAPNFWRNKRRGRPGSPPKPPEREKDKKKDNERDSKMHHRMIRR